MVLNRNIDIDKCSSGGVRDLERLLAPVSEEAPCGQYLNYDPLYDQVREARREDDPTLPRGVWERDLKKSDWGLVQTLCVQALTGKSKDLQLAAWLAEALLCCEGPAGLREGLTIIRRLAETYWDGIYPPVEDGDLCRRVSPFVWMNEKLPVRVKLTPLTGEGQATVRPLNYADWEEAERIERLAVRDRNVFAQAEAAGKATRAKFFRDVMLTSPSFYRELLGDLKGCLKELAELEAFLDGRCGAESPSLLELRETLGAVRRCVEGVMSGRGGHAEEEMAETDVSEKTDAAGGEAQAEPAGEGGVRNRAEAYRMLTKAADYLMATEPHSPAPYLVRRAVAWGNMSLGELFREIFSDRGDLEGILALLGLSRRGD